MEGKMRKIIYWSLTTIALIILFTIKFPTTIYIGLEDSSERYFDKISTLIKLDGETIYETDSLPAPFMGMNFDRFEKRLRMGFHTLEVSTSTTGAQIKKTVFILFNHYIFIAYWEGADEYTLRTGFNPFRFE